VGSPYSQTLISHFRDPRNQGRIREPTIAQEGANPLCGDRVRIELRVEDEVVREAGFTANACAICVASASMLTDVVRNAPLDEIETLTVDDLLRLLKASIPQARLNCVRLPLTVLHTGLLQYRAGSRGRLPAATVARGGVVGMVLAAGRARRFGAQKLLAPFGGSTVLRCAVERLRASSLERVIVVTGARATDLRGALHGLDVDWAENADSARGMSSSIVAGLDAVAAETTGAVLIALGDQPTIETAVIDRLVETWDRGGGDRPVVAPRYRGKRGNPVLFDRSLFPQLRALEGDRGARDLLDAHPALVGVVDVDAPAPLDIDTAADYDTLLRAHRGF
jgi:molybdenum cofactor cytidylyltransferase